MKLPAFTGWGYARDLPRPALTPFHTQFGSIEQKISEQSPFPIESQAESIHSATTQRGMPVNSDLVERFEAELTSLGGEFVLCKTEQAADLIAGLLQSLEIGTVQSWRKTSFPEFLRGCLAGIEMR
jgi:hypothetical protein